MFSGFRGSGKSTELLRLKEGLEQQNYLVLYAEALDYVKPAESIEIADLLTVLAGAFSDALEHVQAARDAWVSIGFTDLVQELEGEFGTEN